MTKDVLQPVDAEIARAAKTFLRTARHGALASLDPATGAPMASRVSVASDPRGQPVFLISRLSGHFAALEADARASILLGEPGKGDPLAHPRLTVFGRAEKMERGAARNRFLARHPKAALYADFADFAFWRLKVDGASYNGGFGKAAAPSRDDLLAREDPGLAALEADAVAHMNVDHVDAIGLYAGTPGDWRIATLDPEGMDLVDGDRVARVWFEPGLTSADELRPRLVAMAKRARSAQEQDRQRDG